MHQTKAFIFHLLVEIIFLYILTSFSIKIENYFVGRNKQQMAQQPPNARVKYSICCHIFWGMFYAPQILQLMFAAFLLLNFHSFNTCLELDRSCNYNAAYHNILIEFQNVHPLLWVLLQCKISEHFNCLAICRRLFAAVKMRNLPSFQLFL